MQLLSTKFLPRIGQRTKAQARDDLYRNVLRAEAKMGGELFGPLPAGHRREFFCLDEYTWVWHEEWLDTTGQTKAITTRYDVRPQGILKSQGSNSYQLVTGDELRNLFMAAKLYRDRLFAETAALQHQA